MKVIVFIKFFLVVFLCTLFPFMAYATVFGPEIYTKGSEESDVYTESFGVEPGNYYLVVTNGNQDKSGRVSSASIYINNEQIFQPSDFNQDDYLLCSAVQLLDSNTIKIELTGVPDSFITLEVTSSSHIIDSELLLRTKEKVDACTESLNALKDKGLLRIVNNETGGGNRISSASVLIRTIIFCVLLQSC